MDKIERVFKFNEKRKPIVEVDGDVCEHCGRGVKLTEYNSERVWSYPFTFPTTPTTSITVTPTSCTFYNADGTPWASNGGWTNNTFVIPSNSTTVSY